jgi:hypothetical protein
MTVGEGAVHTALTRCACSVDFSVVISCYFE